MSRCAWLVALLFSCLLLGSMVAGQEEPPPEEEEHIHLGEEEWEKPWNSVRGDGSWMQTWFHSSFHLIWCAIAKAWCWLAAWTFDGIEILLETVLRVMPQLDDLPDVDFGPLFTAFDTADVFLPVTEAVEIVSLYGVWKLAIIVLRLIKKFIPTMSG